MAISGRVLIQGGFTSVTPQIWFFHFMWAKLIRFLLTQGSVPSELCMRTAQAGKHSAQKDLKNIFREKARDFFESQLNEWPAFQLQSIDFLLKTVRNLLRKYAARINL